VYDVSSGLRDTMGPAAVPKEPSMASKPHYKAKYAF